MGKDDKPLAVVEAKKTCKDSASGREQAKQYCVNILKTIILELTATPTDIIDHNTFELFYCEDGLPTFTYTFEEAINNEPPGSHRHLCGVVSD